MGGWDGGIRVPTLMRWPGVIPAQSTVDVATSQMDIMPTIAAAVGVDMPNDRFLILYFVFFWLNDIKKSSLIQVEGQI